MAGYLSINLDVLEQTANDYREVRDNINTALKDIDNTMKMLQSSKWISEASQAYFTQYSEDWRTSVEHHLVAIEQMSSGLDNAFQEYKALFDQIPTLANMID